MSIVGGQNIILGSIQGRGHHNQLGDHILFRIRGGDTAHKIVFRCSYWGGDTTHEIVFRCSYWGGDTAHEIAFRCSYWGGDTAQIKVGTPHINC